MQIKNEDFQKIAVYFKDRLCANLRDGMIDKVGIIGTLQELTLDDFLKSTGEKRERTSRLDSSDDRGFGLLWKEYPASPNFVYRGMKFKGSRVLRSNYNGCLSKYFKCLGNHPSLTPEMILSALRKQKKLAYEESFETGVNKLNYWNGLEVWLNQEKFMAFINDSPDTDESHEETVETDNQSNYA